MMSLSMITPRVRFAPELQAPAADRPRKAGVVYPSHAQCKGTSNWKSSSDLFWGKSGISSPTAASPFATTCIRLRTLSSPGSDKKTTSPRRSVQQAGDVSQHQGAYAALVVRVCRVLLELALPDATHPDANERQPASLVGEKVHPALDVCSSAHWRRVLRRNTAQSVSIRSASTLA